MPDADLRLIEFSFIPSFHKNDNTMRLPTLFLLFTNALQSEAFTTSLAFRARVHGDITFSTYTKNTHLFSQEDGDEEGASLAADFSKILQDRNIQLDESDLRELDDDEDEDEDGEELMDEEDVDDVTLSDDQVYRELDERVLETAGGFVDLLSGAGDDDEVDEKPKVYEPPTTVPDSSLTAGDVVLAVLESLNHNDVPTRDRGIEILFGYSSPGSSISQAIEIEGMSAAEYAAFLKEEYEYKILFDHEEATIEKGDYSFDKKKAFYTARMKSAATGDLTNVNFILSTEGDDEDSCWLIDSLLIRPEGMRRRRRR